MRKDSRIILGVVLVVLIAFGALALTACEVEKTIKYTVSIDVDGEVITETIDAPSGFTIDVTKIPDRIGFEFVGLYDAPFGGIMYTDTMGKGNPSVSLSGDITLYPHWNRRTYSFAVTNTMLANNAVKHIEVEYGNQLPRLDAPVSTNPAKEFTGWFYEYQDGTETKSIQVTDASGIFVGDMGLLAKENYPELLSDQDNKIVARYDDVTFNVVINVGESKNVHSVLYGTAFADVIDGIKGTIYNDRLVTSWQELTGADYENGIVSDIIIEPKTTSPYVEFVNIDGVDYLAAEAGQLVTLPVVEDSNFGIWTDVNYNDLGANFVMPSGINKYTCKAIWKSDEFAVNFAIDQQIKTLNVKFDTPYKDVCASLGDVFIDDKIVVDWKTLDGEALPRTIRKPIQLEPNRVSHYIEFVNIDNVAKIPARRGEIVDLPVVDDSNFAVWVDNKFDAIGTTFEMPYDNDNYAIRAVWYSDEFAVNFGYGEQTSSIVVKYGTPIDEAYNKLGALLVGDKMVSEWRRADGGNAPTTITKDTALRGVALSNYVKFGRLERDIYAPYAPGALILLPPIEDENFAMWADLNGDAVMMGAKMPSTGNVDINAVWKNDKFFVTFIDGADNIVVTADYNADINDVISGLGDVIVGDRLVTSWTCTNAVAPTKVTKNLTFDVAASNNYVKYDVKGTITYDAANAGDVVTLPIPEDNTFAKWNSDVFGVIETTSITMPAHGNVVCTALFTTDEYALTFHYNNGELSRLVKYGTTFGEVLSAIGNKFDNSMLVTAWREVGKSDVLTEEMPVYGDMNIEVADASNYFSFVNYNHEIIPVKAGTIVNMDTLVTVDDDTFGLWRIKDGVALMGEYEMPNNNIELLMVHNNETFTIYIIMGEERLEWTKNYGDIIDWSRERLFYNDMHVTKWTNNDGDAPDKFVYRDVTYNADLTSLSHYIILDHPNHGKINDVVAGTQYTLVSPDGEPDFICWMNPENNTKVDFRFTMPENTNYILTPLYKKYKHKRYGREYIIHNNPVDNYYDYVSFHSLFGYDREILVNMGYTKLNISFTIGISERHDGYQHVYIASGYTASSSLVKFVIEHSPGGLSFDAGNTSIKYFDRSYTMDLTTYDEEYFYYLYGADGKFDNDWYRESMSIDYRLE